MEYREYNSKSSGEQHSKTDQENSGAFVEKVQSSFQMGLVADVARGKLQYFLQKSHPRSRVSILSGQVTGDRNYGDPASLEGRGVGSSADPSATSTASLPR